MSVTVESALTSLAPANLVLWPRNDDAEKVTAYVRERLERDFPPDLEDFYRAGIRYIGDFPAIAPVWNDHVGWRERDVDVTALLPVGAVPLFLDGCGSLFGLDLTGADPGPAVYFFDHEDGFERPAYAAGSSLGAFLLLLSQHAGPSGEAPGRLGARHRPGPDPLHPRPAALAGGLVVSGDCERRAPTPSRPPPARRSWPPSRRRVPGRAGWRPAG